MRRISLCHFFVHSIFPIASRKALDARRPYRGPSGQRPLRIRFGPKHRAGSESLSQCILRQGQGNSSSQLCVTPLWEAKTQLFTSQKFCRAKVIHNRLRGEESKLSSPAMNNFWSYYKGRGEGGLVFFTYPPTVQSQKVVNHMCELLFNFNSCEPPPHFPVPGLAHSSSRF